MRLDKGTIRFNDGEGMIVDTEIKFGEGSCVYQPKTGPRVLINATESQQIELDYTIHTLH